MHAACSKSTPAGHHGFRPVRARNGAEALVRIDRMSPDLVLLDLSLPVLDGWAVARALRASPRTQRVPILALTAHATLPEIARARACGCDSVFVKPAPHDTLLLEMRKLIRRAADPSGVVPLPRSGGETGGQPSRTGRR